MLALAQYEAGVCDCGFHESVAQDRDNFFTFDQRTCPVCRGAARYARMQAANDESAYKIHGDNPAPSVPHPADGRRTFVKQLSTDEVAELKAPSGPRHP